MVLPVYSLIVLYSYTNSNIILSISGKEKMVFQAFITFELGNREIYFPKEKNWLTEIALLQQIQFSIFILLFIKIIYFFMHGK